MLSFPSGGLQAMFEARGSCDSASPVFLHDDGDGITRCITQPARRWIPPLLRALEVISVQALRVLRVLGNTTAARVVATVGPEQEYFLVDRGYYEQRLYLIMSGRTLFGAAKR